MLIDISYELGVFLDKIKRFEKKCSDRYDAKLKTLKKCCTSKEEFEKITKEMSKEYVDQCNDYDDKMTEELVQKFRAELRRLIEIADQREGKLTQSEREQLDDEIDEIIEAINIFVN